MCEEWARFENFWEDMGPNYSEGLTLERMDNSLGYSKENCQWKSYKHQANNKRGNVMVDTPVGKMTMAEAADRYHMNRTTLSYRLKNDWPPEKLFIEVDYRNRVSTT